MMQKPLITLDLPMGEILAQWPETIPVFLDFQMSCVGCYMSSFDTLEDALSVHRLPIQEVLIALNSIINNTQEKDQD